MNLKFIPEGILILAKAFVGLAIAFEALAVPLPRQLASEVLFEANAGQFDAAYAYRARMPGMVAYVSQDGVLTLAVNGSSEPINIRQLSGGREVFAIADGASETRTNYFFKSKDRLQRIVNVPNYRRVRFNSVFEGVDLVYHATNGRLEFDFEVAPGAKVEQIRFVIDGEFDAEIDSSGALSLSRGAVLVVQRAPVAYQLLGDARQSVQSRYRQVGSKEFGVDVPEYDASRPLIIDPVVEYASYLGGSSQDAATAVKWGADGFIYVAGITSSTNFGVVGAYDGTLGGASDAFVAKINPATGALVYATYLGDANADSATALAVDSAGSAYIAGRAEARFPTTSGAYQTSSSAQAGFVTKLSAAGNALAYSTLLYGTKPRGIAVDAQGRAAVTGGAGSLFVPSAGAYMTALGGGGIDTQIEGDAFAALLSAAGNSVIFATFVGGSDTDEGRAVGFDLSGRVVIGGSYRTANLPAASGAQPIYAGTQDGFVAALAADGKSLAYATYVGGSGVDRVTGLAIDVDGNIVISGDTSSSDFPTQSALLSYTSLSNVGAPQKSFVAKLDPTASQRLFSTFAGPAATCCDTSYGVAVDAAGDIYHFGYMLAGNYSHFSAKNPFMTTAYASAKYGTTNGDVMFVTSYSRGGQEIRYQTLVAACGEAVICSRGAIAARGSGFAVIASETHVNWLPIAAENTKPALSTPSGGTNDAFVMTLETYGAPFLLTMSDPAPNTATTVKITATSYGAPLTGQASFFDGSTQIGQAQFVQGVASIDIALSAGVHRLKAAAGASETAIVLLPVTLAAQ